MWKPTHVDVTVIKAKDLVVKGKGSNDVYAIIQLAKEKFQTTTKEKTSNPEWNEECSFEIPSDMSKTIEITLYHRNLLSIDRFLGRIVLPIDELFSFQEKPHAQWYALRAKTTKKKAKYRGEILVRTTFVVRSDALGTASGGGAQSSLIGKGSTLTPLGSEFLRKSATNLQGLHGKKGSFRAPNSATTAQDKKSSQALASEDGTSRQRLNRSHSLAALTVALRRASFGKKSSKSKEDEDSDIHANRRRPDSDDDDDDDQSESVASRTRVETDEERDDFGTTHAHGPDDSAVIQRKQYSLPHTVGSASQALSTPGGGISRAVSSVSAGTPVVDRFLEREGSGRLKASLKGAQQHNSNDSQVSGTGGQGIQRQPSARSSASESGLSIDARSQSSGLGFQSSFANGTPPKSSTIQQLSNGNNSHNISRSSLNSAPPANTPNSGRFTTMTTTVTTPNNPPKGGSFRLPNESNGRNISNSNSNNNNNSNSGSGGIGGGGGGIALPSFSPRTATTVIPSEVYAQYGRMSREELLQVIARQQIEISRRDDYIDEMLSRVMEKAHWILQKT